MKKEVAKALSMAIATTMFEMMVLEGEPKTDEESKKQHLKDVCDLSLKFLPKKVEITDHVKYVNLVMHCEVAFMTGLFKGDLNAAEVLIEKIVDKEFDLCLKVVETDEL